MVSGHRGFIPDEVFSITARMPMADHEGTQVSPQFRVSLSEIESRNDGMPHPWRADLSGYSEPLWHRRIHYGFPGFEHGLLIDVPEPFPSPAKVVARLASGTHGCPETRNGVVKGTQPLTGERQDVGAASASSRARHVAVETAWLTSQAAGRFSRIRVLQNGISTGRTHS